MDGESIGKNIKAARVAAGLSQVQLGLMLGLSQPRIACIESGRYCPSVVTLLSLASALNLDINILLKGS